MCQPMVYDTVQAEISFFVALTDVTPPSALWLEVSLMPFSLFFWGGFLHWSSKQQFGVTFGMQCIRKVQSKFIHRRRQWVYRTLHSSIGEDSGFYHGTLHSTIGLPGPKRFDAAVEAAVHDATVRQQSKLTHDAIKRFRVSTVAPTNLALACVLHPVFQRN